MEHGGFEQVAREFVVESDEGSPCSSCVSWRARPPAPAPIPAARSVRPSVAPFILDPLRVSAGGRGRPSSSPPPLLPPLRPCGPRETLAGARLREDGARRFGDFNFLVALPTPSVSYEGRAGVK